MSQEYIHLENRTAVVSQTRSPAIPSSPNESLHSHQSLGAIMLTSAAIQLQQLATHLPLSIPVIQAAARFPSSSFMAKKTELLTTMAVFEKVNVCQPYHTLYKNGHREMDWEYITSPATLGLIPMCIRMARALTMDLSHMWLIQLSIMIGRRRSRMVITLRRGGQDLRASMQPRLLWISFWGIRCCLCRWWRGVADLRLSRQSNSTSNGV